MTTAFAATLHAIRRSRPRLSQSRLGDAAGFDHSYVSRLETGSRQPTRAAVLALADALHATDTECDALLSAAGFAPMMDTDPLVAELDAMLRDAALPVSARFWLRSTVRSALSLAQRSEAA